jgi:RNA 3'-terminal phosphate cyclase (GTP)
MEMIKIDGNYGEGGGQIIRTALALSTLTGESFEAFNIRKGRRTPGLKAQHIHCIKGLEQLCDAKSQFAEIGSDKLVYEPGKTEGKTVSIDIGTAGSISLLLQSLLLPCFFSDKPVRLKITGGTSGKWAMPYDFFNSIFVPQIRKYCKKIDLKLIRRGYYPKGGGKIDVKITPHKDKGILPELNSIEQGRLIQIKGISHASRLLEKAQVAERQAKAAKTLLNKFDTPVNIQIEYAETFCPGSGITLWGIFSKDKDEIDINNPILIGADALGEIGKRSEDVGKEAAENLIKEISSKAPIDSHTADNLIPFLALFKGKIKVSEITEHTRTNMWICEQFLGKMFEIRENIISVKQKTF